MLKRINIDNLNQKEIDRLSYKAAFSQYVANLKCENHGRNSWKCCGILYKELKDLHVHVSLEHSAAIKINAQVLKSEIAKPARPQIRAQTHDLSGGIRLSINRFKCTCDGQQFEVLLFYKYITLTLPLEVFKKYMIELCNILHLKGKIRFAKEGINGTVEGCVCATPLYKAQLIQLKYTHLECNDFKSSPGDGLAFDTLSVTVCEELCTMGVDSNVLTAKQGGRHLTPEEFHNVLEKSSPENDGPILLDVRNYYESKIGFFDGAVKPDLRKFSYFPEYVDKNLELFKGKAVLTYCTGGIRCERATAYLLKNTECKEVFQLKGGIHKYLQKYPDGFYKGKLFVFDNRYSIMGEETGIMSSCLYCDEPYDSYQLCSTDKCRQLVLICTKCRSNGCTACCKVCAVNSTGTQQCECTQQRERASVEITHPP